MANVASIGLCLAGAYVLGNRLFCRVHVAQASAPVSADAKASVTKALAEIGCTSEDIDAEGGGYEADDTTCKDGKYDITLDKDFKIVNKEKDND
jgi:hypothetical protein